MATQKKKTAAAQSASSHQKDLARISGNTAAEKKMSEIKKSGQRLGVLDATGAAKSRAEKKTLKSFEKGKVSTPKKADKAGAAEKMIQNITNRYRVTAREARDIVTSVANAASTGYANIGRGTQAGPQTGRMLKDIAKQTGELGKNIVTGKKGTTPLQVSDNPKDAFYGDFTGKKYVGKKVEPGKKRK